MRLLLCALALVVPGYAAARPAGQGAGGVSGYSVSGIHWQLDARGRVGEVSFRLAPANARTVQVSLGAAWLPCAVAGGEATCEIPGGASPAAVEDLSVVASS